MIAVEARLERASDELAERAEHGLPTVAGAVRLATAGSDGLVLGGEQEAALYHITGKNDLSMVVGYANTGKSAMLGVAAENLEGGSGIQSRTIATLEHAWGQGHEQLGAHPKPGATGSGWASKANERYAAFFARNPGQRRRKATSRSPFSTRVRV